MRVLHVFKDYYPPTFGGVEQHINEVVHSLGEFEFSVLTSSRSRKLVVDDDEGVSVVRAPEYFRPVSTPITPRWPRLLRESGADLFHFHMPNPFGEIALLVSRAKTPMVATYHADIIGRRALLPFFTPFQERFLSRAGRIIVSNPRLIETSPPLRDHVSKCVVVPFGVDPSDWEKRPALADEIRDRFGAPLILFFGRLAYYKGLDVLLEALTSVQAVCLIAGSGPMKSELQENATQKSLKNQVHFLGDVPSDVRHALFHAADIFVLPSTSRAEAFGISMLQAMACGVPAISTELGTGTSWVNKHRATGLVVQPGDPQALAGALNTLLADDERRKSMGVAAMKRVRENLTRKHMLDSLAAVYRSYLPG